MKLKLILSIFTAICILSSCKKEDDNTPDLPDTYNFENVNTSGQTARLHMLDEMVDEMKEASKGNTVSAALLLNMFSNSFNPFADSTLNNSGKQLKNKCYSGSGAYNATTIEYLLNYLSGKSSNAGNTWAAGTAGVATSGTRSYFLDEYGVQYAEVLEKSIMGSVFYYQISEVYTREGQIGDAVDNTTVTAGEGTDMEHHWDEAFGYFGVPTDLTAANYADNVSAGNCLFYGKYARVGQNAGLQTMEKVMEQFIKGRWGISNNNYDYRDAAAAQVRKEFELIIVTTAIHYLNGAKSNFADDALRNHELSEFYGLVLALYYNSDKVITNTQLTTLRSAFEYTPMGSPTAVPSFLDVTTADLNAAIDLLSTTYGLDNVKDVL